MVSQRQVEMLTNPWQILNSRAFFSNLKMELKSGIAERKSFGNRGLFVLAHILLDHSHPRKPAPHLQRQDLARQRLSSSISAPTKMCLQTKTTVRSKRSPVQRKY